MDSDGDGLSNGEELGDPHCVWRFGNGVRPTISNATRLSHPGVAGEAGRFTSLVTNARTLDCVLGRGCKTLGTAPGIPTGTMQTRYTAPGAASWLLTLGRYTRSEPKRCTRATASAGRVLPRAAATSTVRQPPSCSRLQRSTTSTVCRLRPGGARP